MKRLKFSPVTKNDYEKNNKPQTNDDLIEAKIFTYNLQVENTLATMVRNGLLSIRIAFLFYMTPHVSPWIGKLIMFVGATVIAWSVIMYAKNIMEIRSLLHYEDQMMPYNAYAWPILCGLFSICIYSGSFEILLYQ